MDNLHLASQVQAGATVVPVFNAQFAPNANTAPIRSSALPFAQGRIIPSRAPVFSFQTFFASAWSLQETLKVKKHTAFTMYMRNTGTDGEALEPACGTPQQQALKHLPILAASVKVRAG